MVFADSGYRGADKRPDASPGVNWLIARRPSSRKPAETTGRLGRIVDEIERLKASVRAKVEHAFRVVKRQFGHTKVRSRGADEEHGAVAYAVRALEHVDGAKTVDVDAGTGAPAECQSDMKTPSKSRSAARRDAQDARRAQIPVDRLVMRPMSCAAACCAALP